MFLYANGSAGDRRQMLGGLTGNEMPIILANEEETIYFTKTHLADLKAVVQADHAGPAREEGVEAAPV